MGTDEKDKLRLPLLAIPEWARGREDGQLDRDFKPDNNLDLYRAGYAYGALERATVLAQFSILFNSSPELLYAELRRLDDIEVSSVDRWKGVDYLIEKHLTLLWPQASRQS